MKEMKRLEELKANNCLLEREREREKTPEEIVALQFSIFRSGSQNR